MQRTVDSLKKPETGNKITWDGQIPGFGVRITAAGSISYVLEYKLNGDKKRYTFGHHPKMKVEGARKKALKLWNGIESEGKDPMEERQQSRDAPTVANLADDYLEHVATYKQPSSLRNDRGLLKIILNSGRKRKLGKLRVKAVTRRDIQRLQATMKRTPVHSNRALALLSKMFTLAIEWEMIKDNPCKGVRRFDEHARERDLDTDELQRLLGALNDYPVQSAADCLRLILFTGCREGEAMHATWGEFNLENAIWSKPPAHTKQKKRHHVPLNAMALALLNKMLREYADKPQKDTPLFRGRYHGARAALRRPWIAICKSAGLAEEHTVEGKRGPLKRFRPTLRIHDLRHSFSSFAVNAGTPLEVLARLLGHAQSSTVTRRYAHVNDIAARAGSDKVSQLIESATTKLLLAAGKK
jgi:integrase